ncbi:MAG: iron-containing alcohol dehydrogenase family protein [Rhodobacterales bacterium]
MKDFSHVSDPLRLHQGTKALDRLAREMDRMGCTRALVITGASLGQDNPVLRQVQAALGDRLVGIWSGVRPHSPLPTVLQAAEALAAHKADCVVALGGGSAIVTARAAAIALAEGDDLTALATRMDADGKLQSPKLQAPKLVQFVVPTTPTTAMVKAGTAVLDLASGNRLALFDPKTRAQAVALDPLALASAPLPLVLDAGFNTLTLAIEGVISRGVDPFAEAFLLQAIRLIATAFDHPAEEVAGFGAELAVAAALAGRGTDHAGAGVATVLAHALGARFDLGHGALNAMFLPEALRFNAQAAPDALLRVAQAFGCTGTEALIAKVEALRARFGMAAGLRDLSIPQDALQDASEIAVKDWFLLGNPRKVEGPQPLLEILEKVW